MNKIHPLIRVGGPILGVLILMYVINFAVDTFRADLKTARDAEREATLAAVDAAQELEAEEAATAEAQAQAEAEAQSEDAQEEAPSENVFFLQPTTNAIVPPTFTVKMGAVGVEVEPSGDIVPGSGHMHILVDTDFIAAGEVIPTDEQHLHYGDASLEAELTLTPGEHTLHLQFADGAHIALEGDQYRDTIVVFVETDAAEQSVAFFDPLDGATVSSPLEVVMAATGLVVEPSGDINEGAGHFHILVDTDFIPAGQIIPTDEKHLHYGKGQTAIALELEPGEHTLRLQFADGAHTALEGDQYRDTITVVVEAPVVAPSVGFEKPADGATVGSPFVVTMAATGLVVEPSGEINEGAGHFHILVDTDFIPAGQVIPTDEQHLHYGKGQTAIALELEPGEHTLHLQFADGAHIALEGHQYRDTITVVVDADIVSPTVSFDRPADGATVGSPFVVEMAATGLVIEPSGEINEGAGHFHILVDTDFIPAGEVIPTDDQHLHYGKGQTAIALELEPGEHTLRLQFADGAHIALEGDQYRDTITVVVDADIVSPAVGFALPADGATVSTPFEVVMAATGLVVEPSGEINEGAGHFHILVDTDFIPAGQVIPTDEQHLHYGKGQTEIALELEPGEHILRLQFADGAHIALEGEQYRDTITVVVEDGAVSPSVGFEQPADGATVSTTFKVEMAATGLVVEPSGEINEGAGHFHILVNTDFIPAGQVTPTDEQHLHYGKGQTAVYLELEPGEHTLHLQFADGAHIAWEGDQYRDTITVVVEDGPVTPSVGFELPGDGATVSSPFDVVMTAAGLVVEPSGDINEGAGHFHILVDTDFIPAGEVIPTDEQHLHYGQGQTTISLELEPGEHTLRLQFADGAHIALEGDQYRDTITVVVDSSVVSPSVGFEQPADGATVSTPFEVVMAATGLVVEPSGEINEGAGHFHILVDTDFIAAGQVIPTDEQHLHYGQGQTVISLELEPGEHTLRLQFADGAHIALEGDQYRDQIDVVVNGASQTNVEETSSSQQLSQETIDLAIAAMTTTGCNSCHITTGLPEVDAAMLGPDQTNLGAIAATRREGYTAEEYLRESILEPSVFLVEECPLGQCLQVMPENYGDLLSEEEVDAIVAYLLSLKTDE